MKRNARKQLHTILAIGLSAVTLFAFSGCAEMLSALNSALYDFASGEQSGGLDDGDQILTFEDPTIDENYVLKRVQGGGSYYYKQLTANQQKFYTKIRIDMDKFFAGQRMLQPYKLNGTSYSLLGSYSFADFGLTKAQGLQAFDAFYQDCPQYYAYDYSYVLFGENGLSPAIAQAYADGAAIPSLDQRIESSVATVESLLVGKATDFEKFSVLYEYVKGQVEYEYQAEGVPSTHAHAGSLTSVLDGNANTNSICVGYTFALTYLCNRFDIECISVGNVSLNHAWNAVRLDGTWYYTDATNDDTSKADTLFLCDEGTFWRYFDRTATAYDTGEAKTVGRTEFLPKVSKDLAYSRFVYREDSGAKVVRTTLTDQYRLRIPAEYGGKPVKAIGDGFDTSASKLRELILPVSVTEITIGALRTVKLQSIFYEGTAEEFAQIEIGWFNDGFKGATVYYYSELQPEESPETKWHYDENGVPVVW